MLKKIYEEMLKIASTGDIPPFIEMVFHIDKEQTKTFWNDKGKENEHNMLFNEWKVEPVIVGDNTSRYSKILYGVKFAIQFNYEKKQG